MALFSFFKSKIFPILLVNFLGIFGYSLVVPILIFIVTDFGGNGFIYGLIGATYPFFQFIGAPRLGKLSDRIGRKKVLIITQIGSFLAWCLFLLAFFMPTTTLWSHDSALVGSYSITLPLLCLFIARMVDGYTGGNISVANAYLSDISTDEDRSKNFGLIGSSTSFGFVIGPVISGLLAATFLGEKLPLIIAAIIALVAVIIISRRLEESNPCVVDTSMTSFKDFRQFFQVEHRDCYVEGAEAGSSTASNSWKEIGRIKNIYYMYAVYFLTFLAFSLFYVSLPIYTSANLQWTAAELGGFLAYFSFVMIFAQGPILIQASRYVSSSNLALFGALLLGVGFGFLSGSSYLMLFIGISIMAIGNGLMWPSFLALLSQMGSAAQQGTIQGYGASMGSIASMMGLIVGGILFEFVGTTVFMVGSVIFFLIALILLLRISRSGSKPILNPSTST